MRWLKLALLIAGGLGMLGFFLPFLHDGDREVTAREAWTRVELDESMCAPRATRGIDLVPQECWAGVTPSHPSYIPLYFAGAAAMVLIAAIALVWRFSTVLFLLALPAGLLAVGGYLRELRVQHHLAIGAVLLLVSGLSATATVIVALTRREPDPPPKQPPPPGPELPTARVVSR